jgi:hypothetical protein
MMDIIRFPRPHLVAIGFLLAIAWTIPVEAGRVAGQITAVDVVRNTIDINGVRFSVATSAMIGLKQGQAVIYEAEKNQIKRIEVVKGNVDTLPVTSGPLRVPGSIPADGN